MAEIIEIEIVNWEKYNPRSDRTNYTWFRFQNDFFTDHKLFGLTDSQIILFQLLLCEASKKSKACIEINLLLFAALRKSSVSQILNDINELVSIAVIKTADSRQSDTKPRSLPSLRRPTNERTNERTNDISESDDSLPQPGLIWNETAEGRPKVTKWTKARAAKAKTFFSKNSESDWRKACCKVSASEFLSGRSGKWANGATFDWLLNETNFTKVLEGNYDDQPETNKPRPDTFFEMASRVLNGIKKFGPDSSDQLRIFLGDETFSIALRVGISRIRQMPAGDFTHKRLAGMLKDACFVIGSSAKNNSPPAN